MRIALIADTYLPMRISAAVQLADLAKEFVAQGHQPLVIVPHTESGEIFKVEEIDNVEVLRVRAPKTKDVSYIRRTLAELFMPFAMMRGLKKSPYVETVFDGVVWYSPSIFHGPLVNAIKRKSHCRSYLILRDIFPEWACDMGLLGRGLPYKFLKFIERYQYSAADVIGVQNSSNQVYFQEWSSVQGRRIEVLHNWLAAPVGKACSISLQQTSLAGRRLFVYAGNMGVAQDAMLIVRMAEILDDQRPDIGFVFVGRGSEVDNLRAYAASKDLHNVVFYDEIDPNEISGLYAQCDVGLVALDGRHKTHNVPGKFLSYMQNGLPVFAVLNQGNDLLDLINDRRVGLASVSADPKKLADLAQSLTVILDQGNGTANNCRQVAEELFQPSLAVDKITAGLKA